MDGLARTTYALFGTLSLLAGAVVLIAPSVLADADDPPVISHLLREEAAAFVFIGLICLWAFRNAAARKPVHLALLVFTTLFALIHWVDYLGDRRYLLSPILNTIPTIVLLISAPAAFRSVSRTDLPAV